MLPGLRSIGNCAPVPGIPFEAGKPTGNARVVMFNDKAGTKPSRQAMRQGGPGQDYDLDQCQRRISAASLNEMNALVSDPDESTRNPENLSE